MYSNKLYTPLRYPGGKAKFAPLIADLMKCNGLMGGHYLEPYAGGAGVALELLYHGHANHIHINDLDPAVHAFWRAVTTEPDLILQLLDDTPINMEQWYHWRSVLRGEMPASTAERGFATLFMNRTNRSGILKGGVIGGKAQAGEYTIDARFKKDVIATRIKKIATHANQISVYSEDALSLLKRSTEFLPDNALIYLDPPYYVKGRGLYRNFYEHKDHVAIAELLQLQSFHHSWVVSYDDAAQIRAMYDQIRRHQYGLNYTAQTRYIGQEIMFFSRKLKMPEGLEIVLPNAA